MRQTKVLAEVVLQAEDGTILLLRRTENDTFRPRQWDVPGGHIDEGEDFALAAARELVEETGITIQPNKLQLAYTISMVRDGYNLCWLFFVAHTTKQDAVLSHEHTEAIWLPVDEAIDAIDYLLQKDAVTYLRDNQLLS